MQIAILGAGTAGLSAAAFLKKSGHDVTIYEKFAAPRALGAGLMLQPTGLAVLARLGLDQAAIAASSPIHRLEGRVTKTERTIFDIRYRDLAPHLFGLGIHRGTLFSLLYEEVLRQRIPIITSASIEDMRYDAANHPLIASATTTYGPYDLVINAQGARSPLRQKHVRVRKDKPYAYAAVWGVCADHEGTFKNQLTQRYHKARHMIGVMPVGRQNGDAHESVAFFWSLRAREYAQWHENGISAWQDEVIALWPQVEPLIRQFKTPDDLNFATYGDVSLRSCHAHRFVCIGDAAHATSPQLGQGANLGLLDAMVLAECLANAPDVNAALKTYAGKRKPHLRFYQAASHWLTPFFQSDSRLLPPLRDACFGPMCRMPFMRTQMLRTLSGIKTGLFTHMNPGGIHPRYDLGTPAPSHPYPPMRDPAS